jgi:hypothetical protein
LPANNIVARNLCCVNCWQELYYTDGDGIYVGGQTSPAETQLCLYHNTLADNGINAIRNDSAAITMSHNIVSGQARSLRLASQPGWSFPPTAVADYTLWWPAMNVHIITGTFTHMHDLTGTPTFSGHFHSRVAQRRHSRCRQHDSFRCHTDFHPPIAAHSS